MRDLSKAAVFAAFIPLVAAFAAPALAQSAQPKGVVELFTSQSCSSCPPADAVLGDLARQNGLIALAYHVDYWNYLGWRDTFSSKKYTDRQRAYAATLGNHNVYTPQVVIDGRADAVGSSRSAVERMIDRIAGSGDGLVVPITAKRHGDSIKITVDAGNGRANLVLVYFDGKQTVSIKDGENSGRTITYWHIVRDVQTVGMWDGKRMSLAMPASVMQKNSDGGCAILLQKMIGGNPGPIIGATVVSASASN